MINIKIAKVEDAKIIALLGTITYSESHGAFINNKKDLNEYVNATFSVAKIKEEINDDNNIFYLVHLDELPVGYAKIVANTLHESVESENNCQLEKIYILDHFIPLKIGGQLFAHIEKKAKEMGKDTIWLSVYKENKRAIRFYLKNYFVEVGKSTFLVNGTGYENLVFSKKI